MGLRAQWLPPHPSALDEEAFHVVPSLTSASLHWVKGRREARGKEKGLCWASEDKRSHPLASRMTETEQFPQRERRGQRPWGWWEGWEGRTTGLRSKETDDTGRRKGASLCPLSPLGAQSESLLRDVSGSGAAWCDTHRRRRPLSTRHGASLS